MLKIRLSRVGRKHVAKYRVVPVSYTHLDVYKRQQLVHFLFFLFYYYG